MQIEAKTLCHNCRHEYQSIQGEVITFNYKWLVEGIFLGQMGRYDRYIHCPRCNATEIIVVIEQVSLPVPVVDSTESNLTNS